MVRENDDAPLAAVDVTLNSGEHGRLGKTETDASGAFRFDSLSADTYSVIPDPSGLSDLGQFVEDSVVINLDEGEGIDGVRLSFRLPEIVARVLPSTTALGIGQTGAATVALDLSELDDAVSGIQATIRWDGSIVALQGGSATGSAWDFFFPTERGLGELFVAALSTAGVAGSSVDLVTFAIEGRMAGNSSIAVDIEQIAVLQGGQPVGLRDLLFVVEVLARISVN